MKRVQRSNVPSLVCVFAASATTGGTMYSFGIFGEALKQTLHLSQSQLNTISSAMFIAGLFSWIPGLFVDRFGTRVALCLGGLTGFLSTLTYWVFARQFVVIRAVVPTLSILGMLTCMSCAMIVGSVFKIILLSCGAGTKGAAVGIAKAYVGLGAGIYTCIFQAIRQPNETPLDFLPMSAFFFFLVAFLPGWLLLPTQEQVVKEDIVNKTTPTHFRVLYTSLLLMAIVVVGSSVADLLEGDDAKNDRVVVMEQNVSTRKYGRALFILAIWLGPIVLLMFLPEDDKCEVSSKPADENKLKSQQHSEEEHDPVVDTFFMATPVASSENLLMAFSSATELRRELSFFTAASSENIAALGSTKSSFPDLYGLLSKPQSVPELFMGPQTSAESRVDKGDMDAHEETFLLADIEADATPYTQDQPIASPTEYHYYDNHNYTLVQMLSQPSAWLMLWTCTIVVGSGTLQTNNIGEMVASRGFPEQAAAACLALFSVSQATARVVTGAVSEAALNWKLQGFCFIDYGIPRPFFLVIASALACLAHVILYFSDELVVFVTGSVLSGIAFGMVWPLMVLIIGEVFGLENHGANYMFYDGFTLAVGTLALSKFLAGSLYDAHLDALSDDPFTCYGAECFQTTHVVVAGLALTSVGAGMACEYLSRQAYEHQQPRY